MQVSEIQLQRRKKGAKESQDWFLQGFLQGVSCMYAQGISTDI